VPEKTKNKQIQKTGTLKKALTLLIFTLLFPAILMAQEHRIGIGIGGTSGTYTVLTTEIDLTGEMVELPVYIYASKVGFIAGAKVMEFTVTGRLKSGSFTSNVFYTQSLLALTLGWNFEVADKLSIAPQWVKSYMGNSRVHFSTYQTDPFYGEYVVASDSFTQNAALTGYEIPIYYTGKTLLIGLKLCAYESGAEIEFATGTTAEIDINGGLAFIMEASF